MLSLSPTLAKRAADALETIARAPLSPLANRETPRHLSAIPPSVRSLPTDLQVVALCDLLTDAQFIINKQGRQIASLQSQCLKVNHALKETQKQRDDLLAFFS